MARDVHAHSLLEEDAFVAVLRTAEQFQRQAAELFKAHELSPTQYNVLRILRGAGAEGLTCRQVGERMLNHDPDITRLLGRLTGRDLVQQRRQKDDRRVVRTFITPAGLRLLQSLDQPVEEFQRRLLGHMGERRLQSLIRLLALAGRGSSPQSQLSLIGKKAKKSRRVC